MTAVAFPPPIADAPFAASDADPESGDESSLLKLLGQVFELLQQAGSVDPERLTGEQAAFVMELYVRIERAAAAGRLVHTRRAAECQKWRQEGHRSAAAWLAQRTKTSVGEAIAALETAGALNRYRDTYEALRRGRLSVPQAKEITAAAKVDPSAEAGLLDAADFLTFKGLQNRVKEVTVAAASQGDGRAELHRRRFLRQWIDSDGGFHLHALLSPDAGVEMMSSIRSRAQFVADERRQAGEHADSREAIEADALVALVTGEERHATFQGVVGGRSRSVNVFLHVDLAAYRAGHVSPGQLCDMPGFGPVPLASVEHVIGDALLTVVLRDGVDVVGICNYGRTVPAPLEKALVARDPVCVWPGCDVAIGLEIDHWQVPFAEGGATALWNLARLCPFHHRKKTYEGFRLLGGPGEWQIESPGERESP